MKIVGIVAEYNPFHLGHAYQITKTRELLGEDCAIVSVMSGDFVQRGEPALYSKYARSEAAVRCGADLVLELPVQVSVSSAERFARGAVEILGRLGCVTHLSFGSESGEISALEKTAEACLSPRFHALVKTYLETGCSYPVARSAALQKLLGKADFTRTANDNLGIEYIKAIKELGYSITPIAIKRQGAMHDEHSQEAMKSGSQLRQMVQEGDSIAESVPEPAQEIYVREQAAGRGPVYPELLEQAMLSRLRMLPESAYAALPDAAEGLEHKLYTACRTKTNLRDIYDYVKSKRYTHARIRRMTMNAILGVTRSDYEGDSAYARVLALNERGAKVLKLAKEQSSIPVLSKPAMARGMDDAALTAFTKTADAHDLYVLAYGNAEARTGEKDWITSPLFVDGADFTNR